MTRGPTCYIPFTTAGIGFAANEVYIKYNEDPGDVDIKNHFKLPQLFRFSLVQLEYVASLASPSDPSFPDYIREVKNFPHNFECLAFVVNAFGRFSEAGAEFQTVLPPLDLHTPHTIRITNLRAIVEKLSTEGDKDFVAQNTIPAARYDDEGRLLNPDFIMPPVYDKEAFLKDARDVESFVNIIRTVQNLAGYCQYSKKGSCLSLVSTALGQNSPLDSISHNGIEGSTHSQSRDWYSMHPIFSSNMFPEGIELYCGVWSEKLERLWPLVKVRYPASAKQMIFDRTWLSRFNICRNRVMESYWGPQGEEIEFNVQPVTCRVPCTTSGLAFAVNDLYFKFEDFFSNCCTIFQFYRYTLVQFEFQCFVASQAVRKTIFYPQYDSSFSRHKLLDSSCPIKASYAENFKSIVAFINSYGYFKYRKIHFGTIPPPMHVHHPDTIQLGNLRAIVEELATVGNEHFKNANTLPGARYDDSNGLLLNADEIMPSNYDVEAFKSDAAAVHEVIRSVATQDNCWQPNVKKCQFSNKGSPSTLVCTSAEAPARDYIPPIPINDRQVGVRASVESREWYTTYFLKAGKMNSGIMKYCGVWSESLEKEWPDMKVRNPISGKHFTTKTWNIK